MNKKITFRGMDSSPVMEKHVQQQLRKIEGFLEHERLPVKIEVILEAHHIHAHHKAEIRISAPDYHILMHEEGADLYKLIDAVLDRSYLALREQKEKLVDRRKKGCVEQCVPSKQEIDEENEQLLEDELEEDDFFEEE
jgi:ribosomal subunit interface protein